MKKLIPVLLIAVLIGMIIAPVASADMKERGKNMARIVVCPFKAVARIANGVVDTVTLQKPAAVLGSWSVAREEATDAVESLYRAAADKEMIGVDDVGSVSSYIGEKWWLGAVVDTAVALPIGYGIAHNSNSVNHVGKAAWTGAVSIGACSAASNLTK